MEEWVIQDTVVPDRDMGNLFIVKNQPVVKDKKDEIDRMFIIIINF